MNRVAATILSFLLTYGLAILTVLGLFAFTQGTGDFAQWGVGVRAGASLSMIVACIITAIPAEAVDQRKALVKSLMDPD